MKRVILSLLVTLSFFTLKATDRPLCVTVEEQRGGHVQGMVYDESAARMYFSFTTRFIVTDLQGNIIGSVDKIHGHLGAMTFDKVNRKVYASLECKDDVIGASISKRLGEDSFKESSFYIAEIDVDKINELDVDEADVIRRIDVFPADEDYAAKVNCEGKTFDHRYACSGIDGVTIAPAFGKPEGKDKFLYVAYGIYGDTERTDNDYQILLRYHLGKWDIKPRKYFIKTGNTSWGVQNLAWDKASGLMLMAVYRGSKVQYPNYTLFAVDMSSKPKVSSLDGVPYHKSKVLTINPSGKGWYPEYGATGMFPLGDGFIYIAENVRRKDEDGTKVYGCNARLYRWDGESPFVIVRE